MIVYVAGPYTKGDLEQNVEAAMRAGLELIEAGHVAVIPHLSHYFDVYVEKKTGQRLHWDYYIELDLALLSACDALVRLPGPSVGAEVEVREAHRLDIPVYYGLNEALALLGEKNEAE